MVDHVPLLMAISGCAIADSRNYSQGIGVGKQLGSLGHDEVIRHYFGDIKAPYGKLDYIAIGLK